MSNPVPSRGEKRSAARLAAVQALYQMELAAKGLNEVFAEFESFWMGREIEGDQYKPAESRLFRRIVEGVVADQIAIDRRIDALLADGWPLKRIEAIMRAILRAGAFELLHAPDVPVKVAISEYVDLASAFVDRDEVGMINAVLDRLAKAARGEELARAGRG
ncbi:transcription antitermination factor NusB [Rhabdaerophilum calidifontis]|uniref:transcription antitermination factor NusB n=1 Tax=Rhabdaerophilum calidifontis TaxID=2604328 RepID=UPI00123AE69C|nr:transcription antitermination factor NusB [Rhabdaerophilum calidifontis]